MSAGGLVGVRRCSGALGRGRSDGHRGRGQACLAVARVLREAKTLVKQGDNAGVHDAIVDADAVAQTADDTLVGQALKLVRHSLGRHAESVGELGDGEARVQNQGVQEAQPRPAREYLEGALERTRVGHGQQWPFGERWAQPAAGLGCCLGRARRASGDRRDS